MTPESGGHFAIDPRASQFTVQAFASGLIAAVPHSPKIAIREWTGDVTVTPETLRNAKLKVVAKTTSFEVLDELRDSDRREIHRVSNNEGPEMGRYTEG